MTTTISLEDISVLDRQVDQLMDYKPIPEHEVKQLCDKVSFLPYPLSYFTFALSLIIYCSNRQKKFSQRKAMSRLLGPQSQCVEISTDNSTT